MVPFLLRLNPLYQTVIFRPNFGPEFRSLDDFLKPYFFIGGRTASALIDEAMKTLKNIVNSRLGGGGGRVG